MFSRPVVVSRPELGPEVRNVISMVEDQPEGLSIPVEELIKMLGITVRPDFHAMLEQRGDIVLHKARFDNAGPKIEREVKVAGFGVRLEIPSMLQGTLVRGKGSVRLEFDAGHALALHKFLFHVELHSIDLAQERITIDFRGASTIIIELGQRPVP